MYEHAGCVLCETDAAVNLKEGLRSSCDTYTYSCCPSESWDSPITVSCGVSPACQDLPSQPLLGCELSGSYFCVCLFNVRLWRHHMSKQEKEKEGRKKGETSPYLCTQNDSPLILCNPVLSSLFLD